LSPTRHALAAALLACACGGSEEILHGLDEPQANQVLVALEDGGIGGRKERPDGAEAGWTVLVPSGSAGRAQRLLADRELPRPRAPGFGEVFGKGSMVPSATEERALYLHALAGELSRSVEAIDGVVEARVHLALPEPNPLRAEPAPPARAAVLVKSLPGARERLTALSGGIQSLVAGAVAGLEPAAVSVVVAEAIGSSRPVPAPRVRPRWAVGTAAAAALGALALAGLSLRGVLSLPPVPSWPWLKR
jgi:type III secretion protein J